MLELLTILRENVSLRTDVKVLSVSSHHLRHVSPQTILPSHLVTTWEMIHLLILVHVLQCLWAWKPCPQEVPIPTFVNKNQPTLLTRIYQRVVNVGILRNLEDSRTVDHLFLILHLDSIFEIMSIFISIDIIWIVEEESTRSWRKWRFKKPDNVGCWLLDCSRDFFTLLHMRFEDWGILIPFFNFTDHCYFLRSFLTSAKRISGLRFGLNLSLLVFDLLLKDLSVNLIIRNVHILVLLYIRLNLFIFCL